MIRWLLYRFLPFYLIFFALVGGVLLLASETGLQLLWRYLQPQLPEQLEIGAVEGRLIDRLALRDLRYRDAGTEIQVGHAWLSWNPWGLLRGQIHIREIVVTQASLRSLEVAQTSPPSPRPAALPRLPNLQVDQIDLRQWQLLRGDAPPVILESARLSLKLRQQQLGLVLDSARGPGWGEWTAQASAKLSPNRLKLVELTVQSQDSPGLYLAAQGDCTWPQLTCESRLRWAQLRWPLQTARWQSPVGELELSHRDQKLSGMLDGEFHGEALPTSQLRGRLEWPLSADALSFTLDWLVGQSRVSGKGSYALQRQSLNFDAVVKQFDLAPWLADYPSAVSGRIAVTADFATALSVKLKQLNLSGPVRGYPLDLEAAGGTYQPKLWKMERLRVRLGDNELKASLQRNHKWRGNFQFAGARLSQLHPQLAGRLKIDARLSGKVATPQLHWLLDGEQLKTFDVDIGSVQSKGHVDERMVQASLKAQNIAAGGLLISRLETDSAGRIEQFLTTMRLTEDRALTELSWDTQWQPVNQTLDLTLLKGSWNFGAEDWELETASTIHWSAQTGLKLPRQCWRSEQLQTCLSVLWRENLLSGEVKLDRYELNRLNRLIPNNVQLSGQTSLHLQIAPSPPQQLQARLQMNSGAISLATIQEDEQIELIGLLPGGLKAQSIGRKLNAQWSFPTRDAGGLSGRVDLSEEGKLDGRIGLDFNEISVLSAFVPEVLRADGQFKGKLDLSGSIGQPDITGALQLSDGRILLDSPEIELRQLSFRAEGHTGRLVELVGHVESGDGSLDIVGRLDWLDQVSLNAQITGQNFLAVDTPESRVLVSPELKLRLDGRALRLNGRLLVPKAEIRPRRLGAGQGLIAPDADQRIVGQDKTAPRYRLSSQIDIVLGQDVSFAGFGLSANIRGKLRTTMEPSRVPTGIGDLRLLNGQYKAYGQDLTIETGRLIFSGGPLTEPGIDVQAYRQATPTIRTGVKVRGPVSKPQFSLYSDPLMRETDQLSYLVLGRAAEAKNESDQAAINNAALALGLKGGDFLAKRFKGKLGLDEVRIGTQSGEDTGQASLVLGKYLSPEIYVSYGIGLFEPIYTFRLRYRLSEKWALETESGVESSGDLFYTIER